MARGPIVPENVPVEIRRLAESAGGEAIAWGYGELTVTIVMRDGRKLKFERLTNAPKGHIEKGAAAAERSEAAAAPAEPAEVVERPAGPAEIPSPPVPVARKRGRKPNV